VNLYISDTHFGHYNAINFDHRPFADADEMDRCLIELWNSRVFRDDNVYILGDFAYRNEREPAWYLTRLKGHKHFVIGNHDKALLSDAKAMSYFESVDSIKTLTDSLKGETARVVLCHYPIVSWEGKNHGAWHIYGHIHRNEDDEALKVMARMDRALNAGCMINNYTPCGLSELIRNNESFRKRVSEAF